MSEADVAIAKKKERVQVVRRRAKVLEMFNRGLTQAEMADALNVDQSTISRDIQGLSLQARDEFAKRIFQERWLELQRMTAMHDGAMKRM
jgi:predicted DNA-binding transcriptional regulator YafY